MENTHKIVVEKLAAIWDDSQVHLSLCKFHDLGENGCKFTIDGNEVASDSNIPHWSAVSHLEFVYHNFFHNNFDKSWHTLEILNILRQARRENIANNRDIVDYPESDKLVDFIKFMEISVAHDKRHHGSDTIGLERFMEIVTPFIEEDARLDECNSAEAGFALGDFCNALNNDENFSAGEVKIQRVIEVLVEQKILSESEAIQINKSIEN